MTLGQRLRRLRLERGMTQHELAHPRYTSTHVSTIESGRRQPSSDALAYFADKLGVTADELSSGRPPDLMPTLELNLQEARRDASRGRVRNAERLFREIRRIAERHDLIRIRARAEVGLGLCQLRRARVDVALRHYERARELLRYESTTLRVDAVTGIAACLRRRGDLQHAIFVLENLKETLYREGYCDPLALFKVHASLVAPYFEAGAHERASDSATKALELAPHCGDDERLGRMYMSAGRTHLERGNFDEAREAFTIAGTLFHRADLLLEIGQSHLALGFGYVREGDASRARRELAAALDIFRRIGSAVDEARALNEVSYVERLAGDFRAARQAVERSIELLQTGIDVKVLANAHREMGLALAGESLDDAQKHLRTAVDLYERVGSKVDVARAYRFLGDLLYRNGDVIAACEEYRTGMAFLECGK